MQTKGKKYLEKVSVMSQLIAELIEKHGGKAAIARKMGITDPNEFKAMQVKLGNYENARARPKADFIDLWETTFGERLLEMEKERKGSSWNKKETKSTYVELPTRKEKDPDEHIRILIKNLDRMGELNEYLLKELKRLQGG
jgi:hypothetical protein